MSEGKQEWIAVGQRPSENGRYLISRGVDVTEGEYRNGKWEACNSRLPVGPTHWMPLPEPPKPPDAFEVWWGRQEGLGVSDGVEYCRGVAIFGCVTYKGEAKAIWNAAIQSTKSAT